jgi:ABC-type multidrug transport system ATPase subunit
MTTTIDGKVTIGGKVIDPVAFRKNIAYVMQDDALLATATPREAITFSANMRLPSNYSPEKVNSLVDTLLNELGLKVCADVMIGGALIKGISGGQRKRTSVGVELITEPKLLFLDEPTSGLDSFSAFTLVTLLKKVAKRSCTMLCTIHQPSSEVFFLFDSVTFLKDGRIFYSGPVDEVVSYFDKFDYHCPSNYNPSDFIMTLAQTITIPEAEEKGVFMPIPQCLIEDTSASVKFESEIVFMAESSFAKQIEQLTYREMINTKRDTAALIGRFGVTIFLNILFGLIFLNAGGKDDSINSNFNSHFGAMTMILISSMFGSAQPVMLSFPFERPMFLREFSTGTCKRTFLFFLFYSFQII